MAVNTAEHPAARERISLRVSVTDRCRFHCRYCAPAEGVEKFEPARILRYEEMLRFVGMLAARVGLTKVHVTGGEPLGRKGICTLFEGLDGLGVEDVALTTNGQELAARAAALKRVGLKRVNVSLDTLQPQRFDQLTGGGRLERTLVGIDAAIAAGLEPVKVNTTVLRGVNDDEIVDIVRFGINSGAVVRFIELMPFGPAAGHYQEWYMPAAEALQRLGDSFDLRPLPRRPGTSSRDYQVVDGAGNRGLIGVISPCSEPFCADCNRLRLTAAGQLLGCLARSARQDILPLLRAEGPLDEESILAKVKLALTEKRSDGVFFEHRDMSAVGG